MYRLAKLNGVEVRSLAHLLQLVQGCQGAWMQFEFHGIKEMIVLKTEKVADATREVCEQNMIPAAQCLRAEERDGGARDTPEADG